MKSNILKFNILFMLTLVLLSSCEKILEMDIESKPSKLVINAWLEPDSLVRVHVSRSIHILDDEEIKIVENASVLLYENGIKIDSLRYLGNGLYSNTLLKPSAGRTYKIEVSAPNFVAASAETTIPDTIAIEKMNLQPNDQGNETGTLALNFKDPEGTENYYMIYITKKIDITKDTVYKDWYPQSDYLLNFSIDNPIIELSGYNFLSDFYEVNQNDMSFNSDNTINTSIIAFSDQSFNGKNIQLYFNTNEYYYEYDSTKTQNFVNLVSISKDYYRYIKTVSAYNDDPFTERVKVTSNIINGYGILLSSNRNKKLYSER